MAFRRVVTFGAKIVTWHRRAVVILSTGSLAERCPRLTEGLVHGDVIGGMVTSHSSSTIILNVLFTIIDHHHYLTLSGSATKRVLIL